MTAAIGTRTPLSARQRAAVSVGASPFLGGIGIAAYIIGARQQPTGAWHALFLALVCAPAASCVVRHHLRSRDSFAVSTTLTTLGTAITLTVAYLFTLAGAAVTLWFAEVVTDPDVRLGSVAVTGALSMTMAALRFAWRWLK